jgi:hypothetical protein
METLPEWFVAARSRLIADRPKPEVMDTPEKAAAEGVPIGTAVLRYAPSQFEPDAQRSLDNYRAREILRVNPALWD